MAKIVPLSKEKNYIVLEREFKQAKIRFEKAKEEMLNLNARGFQFRYLSFSDTSSGVFCPPWKQLCMELLKRFMTKEQSKIWLKSIVRRFPAKEKAPTISTSS